MAGSANAELERVEPLPASLWDRIRAEPERAPEHIALAAAERFAPAAERWIAMHGPGREPAKVARIAYRKHVRLSRLEGGALGIGGVFTAAPDLGALVWIQSRMVFYIAAAYGYDPYDPMRPAELLALKDIYPSAIEARAALDGMGTSIAVAVVAATLRSRNDPQIVSRLVKYAGKRMARHYTARLVPLVAAPVGAVQNGGATKELGRRTIAYYGG